MTIRDCIQRLAEQKAELFFVQIGANDGTTKDPTGQDHDPIAEFIESYKWRGVMVEPVPWLMEKLMLRYSNNSRLTRSTMAISDHCGTCSLWHVPPDDGLPWYGQQLASLRPNVVLKHQGIPKIEQRMEQLTVPCETLQVLFNRHDVTELDLLLIDTEGYDYEILKQLDFQRYEPVIVFEHQHLTPPELAAARRLLFGNRYAEMARDSADCLWARRLQ